MILLRRALGAMLFVFGCSRPSPAALDAAPATAPTAPTEPTAPTPTAAITLDGGTAAPTAGTARLIVQRVMSHCLACPEIPMPPDQRLGYEVLVEVRIDGATQATKQNAFCPGRDGGAGKPFTCPLFDACATGSVDGGDAPLGQVRCGSQAAELQSGPEGTRLVTGGTSRLVDARPLRIVPNAATVRLANHD